MIKIRKRDKVLLPDGATAETLETFITERSSAYKVKRLDNQVIEYYDGSKITLKSKAPENVLGDLISLVREM
jgi:hypothetical protein